MQGQVKWRKLLLYVLITLITEVLLTFVGFDDLANYEEFIFQKSSFNFIRSEVVIFISCYARGLNNYEFSLR